MCHLNGAIVAGEEKSIKKRSRSEQRCRQVSPTQIRDLDWQPSTVMLAPLTQLALGEDRNATTSPTSSARPNRPKGKFSRTNVAIPSGSSCWRRCHEPPGNEIEPGATLFTRMLSEASC